MTDLAEKLILLVATAATSGFVIPYTLKEIDAQKSISEKERDAGRKRQDELISSQSQFLDRLTDTLWRWRYMTVRVTYYGGGEDEERYKISVEAYASDFWSVAHAIRVEISKSYRLVSLDVLAQLKSFYKGIVALDRQLTDTYHEADFALKRIMYLDLNQRLISVISQDIDDLLEKVTTDLKLSVEKK